MEYAREVIMKTVSNATFLYDLNLRTGPAAVPEQGAHDAFLPSSFLL